MARGRVIKPEFWTSEDVLKVSVEERLFYIGFWNFADDSGIFPHKPRSLKCLIFPCDDVDCNTIIKTLTDKKLLKCYSINGESYLRVLSWDKHQTIRHPTYKYPLENGSIPVYVRYKAGTSTGHVPQERREIGEERNRNKKEKTSKKKMSFLFLLSSDFPSLDTSSFRKVWTEWESYRRAKKKTLLESTARKQLAKLASLDDVKSAIQTVERSIEQGWTGLFPENVKERETGVVL